MKKDEDLMKILVLMVLAVTGMVSSDEAKSMLKCVLENEQEPFNFLAGVSTDTNTGTKTTASETIVGMSALASFIGTSVPTACKLAKSGKFDAARLNFGTRKCVWDKEKLLEIARKGKK